MHCRGFHDRARLVVHAIPGSRPAIAGGLASPNAQRLGPATPEPRLVEAPGIRCPPSSRGGVARSRLPRPVPRPSVGLGGQLVGGQGQPLAGQLQPLATGFFYFGDQVMGGGVDEARDVIGSNRGFKIDRFCTIFAHRNM